MYWLGPRLVLPLTYLNSVASSYFWGHPLHEWPLWFFYGIPEIVYPLLSWLLFAKIFKGKYWLPDLKNTLMFLVYAVFVPAIFEAIFLQGSLVLTGKMLVSDFWPGVSSNVLTEFTTTFILTLPFIYHLTPVLARIKLIHAPGFLEERSLSLHRGRYLEISIIFVALALLGFKLEFTSYWYLYGFISFFVGMRFGFGPVIATNLFIMIVAYFIPNFFAPAIAVDAGQRDLSRFFFTANCMFVFAVLNARVITDLRCTDAILKQQNSRLERTNKELDKFVYSVSHDLTAPLKSILGLVRIGRYTHDPTELKQYLERIEKSVNRLEDFIRQALDYSRNMRLAVEKERIDLNELCTELIENFKFTYEASLIDFQFDLKEKVIFQDRSRLKIILNNLLSNSLKYRKQHPESLPYIKISSGKKNGRLYISVEDNGQGIRPEQIQKIFQMFYRGNDLSWGSGLGLYIARETAINMQGELHVTSSYGHGSMFTLELPL